MITYTGDEIAECYLLVRGQTLIGSHGAVSEDMKTWAADQVMVGFSQCITANPSQLPTIRDVRRMVRGNLKANRAYNAQGEQLMGFSFLLIFLMPVISWAIQLLLNKLLEIWKRRSTEH